MINGKDPKVLIVDDNEDVLFAAKLLLKPFSKIIHTEKNPELIPQLLADENYDIIFLDMNFTKDITSGEEGFFWLKEIMKIDPGIVVILITAYGDIETAVRGVKEGATDFILKPWQNEKFLATYSAACKLRESQIEIQKLKFHQKELSSYINKNYYDLIGISNGMQKVFNTISKVAATDANILVLGENGTGKELVARALHKQSKRSEETFISVDMGAISHSLFESELFGNVKGAFTDAKENRAGRFEIANGGTLFLDEIGNIPLELQAKLLTVLQSRQVARVGSNEHKKIDIRLISATNKPIKELIQENKFRQDLLYRINTIEIHIPPLRERKEDIKLLAEHFLSVYKNKYAKNEITFNDNTIKKLECYEWPGNVRELQHAIERCVVLCESNVIAPSDFFFSKEKALLSNSKNETYNLESIEKSVIRKAIAKCDGNISKAAKELGLTRTSLYRRIEKYGL